MALESYKKWTILAVVVAVAGIITIAVITSERERMVQESTSSSNLSNPSGPLIDNSTGVAKSVDELGVNTGDPRSLAIIGDKYFESSQFAQAIEVYKKVIELNPTDVDSYNDMGLAYHYSGRSDMAIDTLKKGAEIVPTYQRIWLSLGYVLLSTGRNEEARPALEKAASLAPESTVGREAKRMLDKLK